jgi:hypothetical protein
MDSKGRCSRAASDDRDAFDEGVDQTAKDLNTGD